MWEYFLCAFQVHGSKAFSQGFQEMRAGGLRAMWQGNAVNVLKGTPQSTLQCLIYAQVRHTAADRIYSMNYWCTSLLFLIDKCTVLCPDEGVHPKQNTGESDGAAAFWLGLCVRCCCSRCLLPFRGIRDQWQVWVLSHFCPVLYSFQ